MLAAMDGATVSIGFTDSFTIKQAGIIAAIDINVVGIEFGVVLSSIDSSAIIGHRESSGRRLRRGSRLRSRCDRRALRQRAGRM